MNWILYGFKYSGKTYYSRRLGLPHLDTDEEIEQREGVTIRDLIAQKGETYFRQIEKEIVSNLRLSGHVIATGGGTLLNPDNLVSLRSLGSLIYLKCSHSLLKKRIFSHPLPTFIQSETDFERIYSQRIPIYETLSSHHIEIDGKTEEEILEALWQVINSVNSFGSLPGGNPTAKPLA